MDLVLITVDSLRFDYVYRDGDPRPSLDGVRSLTSGGTHFLDAFSNAAYTNQSFPAILGGTYPWMFSPHSDGFEPARPNLAELLSEAGYSTGGFHSNPHLNPVFEYDRGFDRYMGRADAGSEVEMTTFARLQNLVKENVPTSSAAFDVVSWVYHTLGSRFGIQIGGEPYVPAETINSAALDWLQKTPSPRFLWVHYMDVHNPYYPHEGTPSEGISERRAIRLFHRANKNPDDISESDVQLLDRLYRGEIQYLDRHLESLLDGVREHVDLDDTTLVFTSDHGEAFNEHGFFFHPGKRLHDELVRIPLIVRGPGFEATEVEVPVSTVDIMPTLLKVAGVDVPDVCVGRPLDELARERPDQRYVFAEAQGRTTGKTMIANSQWKLIRDLDRDHDFLYDRVDDPAEMRNLVAEEPPVYRRLSRLLDEHLALVQNHDGRDGPGATDDETGEGEGGPTRRADAEPDRETLRRLRQLGYRE